MDCIYTKCLIKGENSGPIHFFVRETMFLINHFFVDLKHTTEYPYHLSLRLHINILQLLGIMISSKLSSSFLFQLCQLIVGRFKKYHTHTLEVERNFYAASIENRTKSTMTSFVQALKHGLITPYNMISCYYCDQ